MLFQTVIFVACSSSQNSKETAAKTDHSERLATIKVPEGYSVEVVAGPDLVDYPMFGTVDETGRLFLFESTGDVYAKSEDAIQNPKFRINLLEDTNEDGIYDKSTIFADKVGFPQGGVFYKGSLYASSAPDLLKLTDTNGDGVADKREVLLSGWILNVNANSLIGPFIGPDGWLYLTNAIMGFDLTTKEGQRLKGGTARIWRVQPDGSKLEWISAGGMNNPVELTFTEAAEPIGTETYFTDPKAGQRDALVYWTEGGVYPKPNKNIDRDSLVRTGELMPVISKYSRVSPAGIGRYRNTALGEDFKDNLFSAQFNTHRIIRHKLIREGASFHTEDQVFFSTTNEDFHPTDVLEDGDGSLLVVETGGWFIKGCPLSQVSKPELQGAVYRVRRKNTPTVDDPFGKQINWNSLEATKAVSLLSDDRPFVRDRAVQRLVDLGETAVIPLSEALKNYKLADVRTKAVFILYRIGTDKALTGIRSALGDADLQVRVAAARSVGLAKDKQAINKLMEMVAKDEAAAKRQAATALGQIGAPLAVPALLSAADGNSDRFIQHAIIYSLITLNQPAEIQQALAHTSSQVQEVAMIALDQMAASTLQAGQVMPFLTNTNKNLQHTALWVASHHPEWAKEMIGFLEKRLKGSVLSTDEIDLYGEMLVSFCGNTAMQQFMANALKEATTDRKLFLMDAMAKCPGKEFPPIWTESIGSQLTSSTDPLVQAKVLELVNLREITFLSKQLKQAAENTKIQANIRIAALGALLKTQSALSESQFQYLYSQLQAENEAPLRQQAATVLAQSKLSEEQLMKLATEYLPKADAFILPRLIPVFQHGHTGEIGKALATTLMNSKSLDSFSEENMQTIFASYPQEVKPGIDSLLAKLREVQAGRLKRLQEMEGRIADGDLEKGRTLFFGKAICWTCHKIGNEGGKLGPDLTSIQKDRSAHDLLEAIVYPSVSFVREYETYRIKTKTGEHTGVIQEKTPQAIVLGTTPQNSVRIPREEIVSMEIQNTSMMPQGLDQLLTPQEMADLMAFILGQDQDPETDQSILR
ncbi:c-type cytochrome [Rhodocytophaga rosea]|uniref:C-type cytochrome n=1 Tax=Rhodocytophaga rosea TaxID=2704465 RepID=A0A6C0GJD0_9BACT|nr:PVC-type heme-binding CxxCH protein [Rhodocytophaga rosea]QHT68181.1 c-type cytochrome [Rhodocytophaga rosea]